MNCWLLFLVAKLPSWFCCTIQEDEQCVLIAPTDHLRAFFFFACCTISHSLLGSFCCFQYRFYMKQVNLWCVLLVLRIRCASGLLSHYVYPSTFILCYGHLALLIDYYALQGLLERYEYSLWFSQSIEAPGVELAGGSLAGHRSRRFCL